MSSLINEKIQQAVEILKEKNVDMWLTFVRESGNMKDPMIDMIVGTGCTWQTAYILTKQGDTIAILGSLDVANMQSKGTYKEIIGYVKGIREDLQKTLSRINPNKIAVNYSFDNNLADGLTHGMYLQLAEHLRGTPYFERLISSDEIVASLRGRKSQTELELMKEAIKITLDLFNKVYSFIKPGVSEKQVANFLLDEVKKLNLETAWEVEHCPAVFTGPDTAGAHAGPTDRLVQRGDVLNIDFGVKYKEYCSDLQRTWYILKEGETEAPPEVKRGFQVIVDAIQKSADAIRPGKQGCEIDDIARNYIVNNGYEEYPHGLGHQIGRKAHDGGGLLAPRWERYGNIPFIPIEKGQVYTIEPRLKIKDSGIATIEEMVFVKDDGVEFLSNPQKEIYLIRG
jgi:Xaa-Pro aminopeptidase